MATTKTPATTEPVYTGEVEIKRAGDVILLPSDMDYDEGITWLKRKRDEDNAWVDIHEHLDGFIYDAANAFNLAVQQMFGMKAMDPFRNSSVNVPLDADGNTINVYCGAMEVPNLEGKMNIGFCGHQTVGIDFHIRHKERPKAMKLMKLAREIFVSQSIYKGKAFRLKWEGNAPGRPAGFHDPEFMKPATAGMLQVNDETREVLDTTVLTPIRQAARCRQYNIPLKRAALLEGAYGTGKTLFSAETAKDAVENGWTFIYLLDVARLAEAFNIAVKYQPAVLFAEDVDLLMDGSDDVPAPVRNTLDGVESKNAEVIVVLTTNHREKMPKSMLRPGRLDAVVTFQAPDAATSARLIRQYAGSLLAADADLTEVGRRIAGQIPAVIREVVERSKLKAIARSEKDDALKITTGDLIFAVDGMTAHLALLNREIPKNETAIESFGRAFGQATVLGAYAAKENYDLARNFNMPYVEKEVVKR